VAVSLSLFFFFFSPPSINQKQSITRIKLWAFWTPKTVPFLAATASTADSKPAYVWIGRMNMWASHTWRTPLLTSREHKPVHPLGRLIPAPHNKTEKQQTVLKHRQWRGWVERWTCPGEWGWGKELNSQHQTLSK
jgi:hypothetical protein